MTAQERNIARGVALVCKGTMQRLMERAEILGSGEMIQSAGYDAKGKLAYNAKAADATRLTSRTNRFKTMLLDGSRGGLREGRKSPVQVSGSIVTAEKVITLPYFAIHEFGGTVAGQSITAKQRKFFWAMHLQEAKGAVKMLASVHKARGTAFRGKKAFAKSARAEFTMWKAMALKKGAIGARTYRARPTITKVIDRVQGEIDSILQQEIQRVNA